VTVQTYHVELDFIVSGAPDELEDHLDRVLDHLLGLTGVIDPDYTASLASGAVTFTMMRRGDASPDVLAAALSDMRTAIHACDGMTAGWEDDFREAGQSIRPNVEELLDA